MKIKFMIVSSIFMELDWRLLQGQFSTYSFDFSGLTFCYSDKSIKVFEVHNDKTNFLSEIRQHDGPVWQVSWAHPKYGALLASGKHLLALPLKLSSILSII